MLKKLFSKLIPRPYESNHAYITVQLNDKVGPIDRHIAYEEPLTELLTIRGYGEISGGGTAQELTGEIALCDIEIELFTQSISHDVITDIIHKMEELGAPKGSKLFMTEGKNEIPFGTQEGLGLYMPAADVPEEPRDGYDLNFLYEEIIRLTNNTSNVDRSWGGKEETALYFYGNSFDEMKKQITGFIQAYPLCRNAKLVQIA